MSVLTGHDWPGVAHYVSEVAFIDWSLQKHLNYFENQQNMRRRTVLALPLLLLEATVLGSCSRSDSDKPITFDEAKADPELRQQYLDQVLEREQIPDYVLSTKYQTIEEIEIDTRKKVPPTALAYTDAEVKYSEIGTQTIPSEVYVTENAFNDEGVTCEDDLLNVIVDHEHHHARLWYDGFGGINLKDLAIEQGQHKGRPNETLFDIVPELLAYENQIKEGQKRDLSSKNRTKTLTMYVSLYVQLWETSKASPQISKELKRRFWRDELALFTKQDEQGRYFQDKKNQKYYLNG